MLLVVGGAQKRLTRVELNSHAHRNFIIIHRIFVFVDHYPATSLSAYKINKTVH